MSDVILVSKTGRKLLGQYLKELRMEKKREKDEVRPQETRKILIRTKGEVSFLLDEKNSSYISASQQKLTKPKLGGGQNGLVYGENNIENHILQQYASNQTQESRKKFLQMRAKQIQHQILNTKYQISHSRGHRSPDGGGTTNTQLVLDTTNNQIDSRTKASFTKCESFNEETKQKFKDLSRIDKQEQFSELGEQFSEIKLQNNQLDLNLPVRVIEYPYSNSNSNNQDEKNNQSGSKVNVINGNYQRGRSENSQSSRNISPRNFELSTELANVNTGLHMFQKFNQSPFKAKEEFEETCIQNRIGNEKGRLQRLIQKQQVYENQMQKQNGDISQFILQKNEDLSQKIDFSRVDVARINYKNKVYDIEVEDLKEKKRRNQAMQDYQSSKYGYFWEKLELNKSRDSSPKPGNTASSFPQNNIQTKDTNITRVNSVNKNTDNHLNNNLNTNIATNLSLKQESKSVPKLIKIKKPNPQKEMELIFENYIM